ncbi:MAG: hypothetical protein M0025_13030 [Elusimicrobia bacterium]|nr:hypothetical protein [Elusimicrobiota bacterium]
MANSKKTIGAGLAVAAIAAAAVYFLTGKRGRENREKIAVWTLDMKAEVLRKMRQLENINKEAYYALVDAVAVRYERVGRATKDEAAHLAHELKGAWKHIGSQLK